MAMTDPIADFLTRIRNGIMAAHETVEIPSSTLKAELARILREQGYIESFETVEGRPGAAGERIVVRLKYTENRTSVISGHPARVAPRASGPTSTPSTSPRCSAAWAPRSCRRPTA